MSEVGKSIADKNRRVRQETLRELLSNKGLAQQVLEISEKIANLAIDMPPDHVNRLKIAMDAKMKLVAKYLPDLKQTELVGDIDQPIVVNSKSVSDDQLAAIIANASSD